MQWAFRIFGTRFFPSPGIKNHTSLVSAQLMRNPNKYCYIPL